MNWSYSSPLTRGSCAASARCRERVGARLVDVVADHGDAGAKKIPRDRTAHHAESDDADAIERRGRRISERRLCHSRLA